MATTQFFCTRSTNNVLGTAAAMYGDVSQAQTWSATETLGRQRWEVAGNFRNLIFTIPTAPGAGTSWTVALRINGADSGLTCTIADANTTARLTGTDGAVAAGDIISWKLTHSGTPANIANTWISVEFEATAAGESGYGYAAGYVNSFAGTYRNGLFLDLGWYNGAGSLQQQVIPVAGTIDGLGLLATGTLSAGQSQVVCLYLNGVKQDGTGGTVNTVTTVGAGQYQAWTPFTLAVVPGDFVYVETVQSHNFIAGASPTCKFTATTDGEAMVFGGSYDALSPDSTRYLNPNWASAWVWQLAESAAIVYGGVSTVTLDRLRVELRGTPGAGNNYAISLRQNGASPAGGPGVTIADAETSAYDATGTVTIADEDTWDFRSIPTSSPTVASTHWAMRQTLGGAAGSESPSISASVSASVSASESPSVSPSQSVSQSESPSATPSVSASVSASVSPSVSESISPSLSPSASGSVSESASPSASPSISESVSPSVSGSESPSASPSQSESASASLSPSRSASLSLSRSPSGTPSRSPSPSPSPSISSYNGICWGEQYPDADEQPVSWQAWEVAPAIKGEVEGDPDWGRLEVAGGDVYVSSIVDMGDDALKRIWSIRDKYGIGTGTVTVSVRGSAMIFGQHDASPAWATYTGAVTESWRYVQWRLIYVSG